MYVYEAMKLEETEHDISRDQIPRRMHQLIGSDADFAPGGFVRPSTASLFQLDRRIASHRIDKES